MKLFVGIRNNRKNVLFVRNISDFQIFPPCLVFTLYTLQQLAQIPHFNSLKKLKLIISAPGRYVLSNLLNSRYFRSSPRRPRLHPWCLRPRLRRGASSSAADRRLRRRFRRIKDRDACDRQEHDHPHDHDDASQPKGVGKEIVEE